MAIPAKWLPVRELVVFLDTQPRHRAHSTDVYDKLVKFFPDVTEREKSDRYSTGMNHWANRVQYARLQGVEEGLIYRSGRGLDPQRGLWILTDAGIEQAKKWRSDSTVGQQLAALEAREKTRNDLRAFEMELELFEGSKHERLTSYYERCPELRADAVQIHGTVCIVCGFDFGEAYGPHGEGFIEVHHLKPVSTLGENSCVNARTDMTVLCANCHRMIHRHPEKPLTINQLKDTLRKRGAE